MGGIYSQFDRLGKAQVVWKWEHRPGDFRSYPSEVSNLIEKRYRSGSTSLLQIKGINQCTYQIDLKELVQINSISKRRRKIRREVQRDTNSTIRWSWENESHEMQFYSIEISKKIEAHFLSKNRYPLKLRLYGRQYLIDTTNKFQLSLSSQMKRRIERNTIPDDKYIWQLQQDDGSFMPYDETTSNKIEAHYSLRKKDPLKITINYGDYLVDTERMLEVNSQTNKNTQIRRVQKNYVKYGWFWEDLQGKWTPFGQYFVEKFDQNFLSTNQSPLQVTINSQQFEIDTKQMTEQSLKSGKIYKIKREPLSNDRAVWLWVNKNGGLQTFPSHISRVLETQYMLNDRTPMIVELRANKYMIDIAKMEKVHEQKKTARRLERRLAPNNYPSELELLSSTQCKEVFKYLAESGYVPPDWDWHQTETVSVLTASDTERIFLLSHFQFENYDAVDIFRIQNKYLINYFLQERMNITNFLHGADEPTLLFYLAGDEKQNPEEIYEALECGLEGKFSGRNEYGKGYYFTRSLALATKHAFKCENGHRILLCFWVLLGRIASINNDEDLKLYYKEKYNTCSEIMKEPVECDSISGLIEDDEVYVMYKPEWCYPLFMLQYKE